jgi:HlyD family secretion protein
MKRQHYAILAAVAAVAIGSAVALLHFHRGTSQLPTAGVQKKEFVEYQQIRGELKAQQSIWITAPAGAGDLQILKLVKTGTTVKKGEVVVQFDTTTLQRTLQQQQTAVRSADAQIEQGKARSKLDREQKETDVLGAKYSVERAKLDVTKQEILSEIEAKKTTIALADSEQKLAEVKEKVAAGEKSGAADIESLKLKRSKAMFDLKQAERQLATLTLYAPADGMVTLSPNWRARTNFGDSAPEFKQGDRAWGGASIAEIPDLSSVRVIAHVDEIDRGALAINQPALVHVDAVPDREFTAYIAEISVLGKPDFSSWPPPNNFDVVLQIQDKDARLRPGMNASARIVLSKVPQAIVVPSEAVFEKNGRTVVYVQRGSEFTERTVDVLKRSGGDALISAGLKQGERVALKDPNREASAKR